jgi:Hg(II)-responsive transcriptional regulator
MKTMTISRLASEAGVTVSTLRYYERRGLLQAPSRRASGYRNYPVEAVHVVRFIKHAQTLGFTLTDIKQLLELAAGSRRSCNAVKNLANARIDEMQQKIRMLEAMSASLARLVMTCDRPQSRRECPLLEAIDEATR